MARILLVDDEVDLRRVFCRILQEQGHVVQEADSGTGALDAMRRTPADLVVTDLVMADMHGAELVRRLVDDHPTCRFIALTGDESFVGSPAWLELTGRIPSFRVVMKPFKVDALISAIERVLTVDMEQA